MQEEGAASELPVLAAITNTHQAGRGPGDPGTFWKRQQRQTHTLSADTDWLCTSGQEESLFFFQEKKINLFSSSSRSPFSFQITRLSFSLSTRAGPFVDSPATCLDNLAFPSG